MTATGHDDDLAQLVDPLVVRARQRVGQVLCQKWRLDVLLGAGGMAAVYAAAHRNGSRVAIKILHPELSVSADVRTRFQREGYAANSVGHDGVVRVSDDDVAEDGSA
jgi:serine/threonine-protein kinase